MNGAFHIGAVGLQSQQRALDILANNIANMNTLGFKRSGTRFVELVGPASGGAASQPLDGVRSERTAPVFAQGALETTGAAFDVAIDGDGFLELQGRQGEIVLWRGGALGVSREGLLEARGAGLVLRAMITVPREAATGAIDRQGAVRAVDANGVPGETLGQLDVVKLRPGAAVTPRGEGLYDIGDAGEISPSVPGEDGAGVLVQGALERSNVQLSEQMVAMMLVQRAFAASAQVVQAGDQLMSIANNLRR